MVNSDEIRRKLEEYKEIRTDHRAHNLVEYMDEMLALIHLIPKIVESNVLSKQQEKEADFRKRLAIGLRHCGYDVDNFVYVQDVIEIIQTLQAEIKGLKHDE